MIFLHILITSAVCFWGSAIVRQADDMYADDTVIEKVVECLSKTYADTCYGDLAYVSCSDINKTIRY